jgi:hypothetical protein
MGLSWALSGSADLAVTAGTEMVNGGLVIDGSTWGGWDFGTMGALALIFASFRASFAAAAKILALSSLVGGLTVVVRATVAFGNRVEPLAVPTASGGLAPSSGLAEAGVASFSAVTPDGSRMGAPPSSSVKSIISATSMACPMMS